MKAKPTNKFDQHSKAIKSMMESEEILQYIVRYDPNAIAIFDCNLHYIAVSDRYLHDYDVREKDIIGKHHYEVFPEMPQKWKDVHQRCLAGAIERNEDDSFERPDGSITYNSWECRPWRRVNSEIGGIIIYSEVTTERKKAELALKESEEKYRYLFAKNPQPMWIFDIETFAFLEVNDAAINHYGYSKDEFLSMTAMDIRPAEEIPTFKKDFQQNNLLFKSGTVWRHIKKNGDIIFVEITSNSLLFNNRKARHVLVNDITSRLKAEEELRVSEVHFRTLYENAKIGLYRTTPDGQILLANKELVKMLGYPSFEKLAERNLENEGFEPSYQRSDFLERIEKEGEINEYESVWNCHDGTSIIARESARAIRDSQNKTLYYDGVVEDITARKQAEEKLLFRNILLATQQEALIEGILVVDKDNTIVSYNHRLIEMLGIPPELVEKGDDGPVFKYFTNEMADPQSFLQKVQYLKEHKYQTSRDEIVLKNGLVFDSYSAPMVGLDPDSHRDYFGRIWSFHDITELKLTQARLSEQADAMEATIDGVAILNATQHFTYMNKSYAAINGYDHPNELIGCNWQLLYNMDEINRFAKEINPEIRQKGHYQGRALGRKKDGSLFSQALSLTTLKNGGMICTIRDITDQVSAEQELILAKQKAEESDRLKSAFLANMSHEVRTPLNSIIGFSELLADPYFNEERKYEFIEQIIQNGKNLLTIISDILDISKMESGTIKIHCIPMNVDHFISNNMEQFSFQAEAKKLKLKLTLPETNEKTFIFADTDRLSQIFNNLIGNAIKFTEKGQIEIGYHTDGKKVEFYVRDTGIGIPSQYHTKIFDRFRQIEDARSRMHGGNGLGLAISKNLVELMGGTIWVESEPGKGSVFYFTIPCEEKVRK